VYLIVLIDHKTSSLSNSGASAILFVQCQRQYCSPLNVLFSGVQVALISLGVPPLGDVKKGRGG